MRRPKRRKRCFVISSYGRPETGDGQELAFWSSARRVIDDIINEALRQLHVERNYDVIDDIRAMRGDDDTNPDAIMPAIFRSIEVDGPERLAVVNKLKDHMRDALQRSGAPVFRANLLMSHAAPFGRCVPTTGFVIRPRIGAACCGARKKKSGWRASRPNA